MEIIKKIIYVTIRDIIFCLCLLFLCFNPYAELSDKWRVTIIFAAFILYLLIPRIINCITLENVFDAADFNKLSEQKKTFFATLSHDLKTQALSQITSLQMLLSESFGALNTEQKNIVRATLNSLQIYERNDFLQYLRLINLKSGTATLNYEVFDAIALINECIEETKSLALQKGIEINVFTETPDGCNICADKIHIKRVIMNLLANAINYAHKNSIVKINAVNDRGYFRFYVENSGEYIENEIIKQLFKKYSSFSFKIQESKRRSWTLFIKKNYRSTLWSYKSRKPD